MSKKEKKSRNFSFTINNPTEDDYQCLREVSCRWIIGYDEVGESGTKHIQGALSLDNATTIKGISRSLPRARLVPSAGTPAENRRYCLKGRQSHEEYQLLREKGPNYGLEASGYERGTCPMEAGLKGAIERERWAQAFASVEAGKLEDVDPQILCLHLAKIEYAVGKVKASKREACDLDNLDNEWHWGAPKSGKSRVRKQFVSLYKKMPHNKWWDGYDGEDVVFIDDFADKRLVDHVLNWADEGIFRAETKGGSMEIRPKRIIVTSQFHPMEYADNEQRMTALMRRFQIFEHKHDPNWSEPAPIPITTGGVDGDSLPI